MFYYRPYARRSNTVKTPKVEAVAYTADLVWGAAAHAHRVNGGYFKTPAYDETGTKIVKPMNRDIMKVVLADSSMISEADMQMGNEARSFLAQQLTMKTLKGQVSDFDRTMSRVVGLDDFTSNDRLEIAMVASQIGAYQRAKKESIMAERIDASLGYLAEVGTKVQARVEITRSVWSNNFGVNFISGITDTNQAVFFSYREKLEIGSWVIIKGIVKAHRPDATQLSRVRVI